mgnify:CR=1 FL=1
MMNKKDILLEMGRYDSLTRRISNDIFSEIKKSEGKLGITRIELPWDTKQIPTYNHESGLVIEVALVISRTKDTILYGNRELPYYVFTYLADEDSIVVEVSLDELYGKSFYEEIFYKINEDVRHEIEHLLQEMGNGDREVLDLKNSSNYETTFDHHKDKGEVAALVHGFYRRAKLEKKPIDIIMLVDLKKDIVDGKITPEEADKLLQLWINYSMKNLPKAQYTQKLRRRFILNK